MEYLGEVLHEDAYHERKERYQEEEGRSHYYFMTPRRNHRRDGSRNVARFLNHSCAPNCETQKWMVRGELCIGIFATRDIAAGEELTIDYKFERLGKAVEVLLHGWRVLRMDRRRQGCGSRQDVQHRR